MRRWTTRAGLLAALAVVLASRAAAHAQVLHRFAVVVGNDQGGPDTRPLIYAGVDAAKVYDILTRLGGVQAGDAALVVDSTAGDVLAALAKVGRQAAAAARAGERTALIFYYSGHAKDGALRLGDSRLPIDTLRGTVAAAPVDVRIVILDACRSGVVSGGGTRTKGARKAPAFAIESESPRDAKGMVILTSSASDEDSQESDAIGGSYFSHHLASGLLGGADRSGDGRVTLFEAYAYAYDRTVADTADSLAGAQHPTFSYDLAGNGDLVLTDVATRHEGIYIPRQAPGGVYYLVDRQGFVAAEINKGDGADRRVALAPGRYRVKRRLPDRLRVGEIDVARGELVTLEENRLHDAPFSADPVKGGRVDLTSRWSMGAGIGYQAVFAAPDGAALFPPTALIDVDFALRDFLRRDWVLGFDLAGGSTNGVAALPAVNAPFHFTEASLAGSLSVEWPHRWLTPFVGGRLALLVMSRRFDDGQFPDQFFSTLSPGLLGGASFRLSRSTSVIARGRLHYLLYNVDGNRSLGYWELATTVAYDF
ncbi:MAG TPA: caspase family protein [Polyangia bacterium]|nr:caspase family protein [Polyangia bacterium]